MTTHAYYAGGGGDYDSFYRSNQRHMSHAAYYDRVAPYGYYEQPQRNDNRSEYPNRAMTRTMIHEPEQPAHGEERPRKRISVACRRCRKRKIRCSGDLGDGLGCSACRHAGSDGAQCAFIRVGAKECCEVLPGIEITPMTSSAPPTTMQADDVQPSTSYSTGRSSTSYHGSYPAHRPSLPTLHTRSAFPVDYDTQYETSSLDGYGYVPHGMPRQDSFANACGLENYRSWSTTAPISAPMTATYYEPMPAYSFGTLQAPTFPQGQPHGMRLPSVTAESFAPFHMSPLNASLPSNTIQERRLPIPAPYTLQYPSSQPQMPQARPLGSYTEPRVPINGIHSHSRSAMPWSLDSHSSGNGRGSVSSYAPPMGMPVSSTESTTVATEPVLGYQWSIQAPNAESSSPEVSPTSGAAASENHSSSSSTTSMPSRRNFRYHPTSSSSTEYAVPVMAVDDRTSSTRVPPPLYTFSTESVERQASNADHIENGENAVVRSTPNYACRMVVPALSHAPGDRTFQRRPSYDEQRASTAHRMSLSNLNTTY